MHRQHGEVAAFDSHSVETAADTKGVDTNLANDASLGYLTDTGLERPFDIKANEVFLLLILPLKYHDQ